MQREQSRKFQSKLLPGLVGLAGAGVLIAALWADRFGLRSVNSGLSTNQLILVLVGFGVLLTGLRLANTATCYVEGSLLAAGAAAVILFLVLALGEYMLADALNGSEWIGPGFSGFTRNIYIFATLLYILATKDSPMPFEKQFNYLGSRSLGIYMGNIPFIYVTAVIMYRLTPALLGMQFLYQPILFAAGLFGPLGLMWVVRNSPLRAAYRTIFG